ncbi:MAG: CDP-diacylglycerol--serine O-phosphatidyltransferase [Bacteroidales bacterium]|jgi:CDP-diacylglycerol--serine O-phosphatidyltransferase|nr:CDP-diacylglycerol--serine O-phosphatidyltransferase [Bacteroidales bacterium]
MIKHIPNLLTSLNLASGFISIIFAAKGDLVTASWFIAAAMVFDFSDGFTARLLKAYSAIGKELDSLADIVSFGVSPALMIYQLITNSIPEQMPELSAYNKIIFTVIISSPVLMPVCAGLRLAVFNVDPNQYFSFKGLPTPANAIGVISVILGAQYSDSSILDSFAASPLALAVYTIVLSILMVTRIPLLSLKMTHLRVKGNEGRYILAALVVVSFAFLGFAALPLIIPFYLASSWISTLF